MLTICVVSHFYTFFLQTRKKNLDMPGKGTLDDLKDALEIKNPTNLEDFLKKVSIFSPAIKSSFLFEVSFRYFSLNCYAFYIAYQ